MEHMDNQQLAEERLTIIRELHELGTPNETKDLNKKILNGLPTYARFKCSFSIL